MFNTARLKLTGWYLLIIMSISLVFSLVIYQVLTNELERLERTRQVRIERRIKESIMGPQMERFFSLVPIADPDLVDEARKRIFVTLGLANLAILVVSGGLGFVLAGQTLAPIKEMMDEQARFISDASHELRTPLTSLKSSMEVYLRDKKPTVTEAKLLVGESIEEVDKLKSLSDSLLQLSRYQRPNGNNKFEKISAGAVVEETVRKMIPIAMKKKVAIKSNVKDIKMTAEKNSLVDMLVILLDNAVKYSPNGGEVEVSLARKDRSVIFEVSDQGMGIAPADVPYIFDRFYRGDAARRKDGAGGYGLGLAIAKEIAGLHGGTISVKSKKDDGTIFQVKIPIKAR